MFEMPVVEEGVMPNGNAWKITPDPDPENPREWDNLGLMLFFHKRHVLGDFDKNPYKSDEFPGWGALEMQIREDLKPAVMIPVSMLDHGGLHVYEGSGAHACDPGGWDSGRIGFALITEEAARKEFKVKKITPKLREKLLGIIRSELETYDKYLKGEIYGFEVEDGKGNFVDSCWGFYDFEYCKKEALQAAAHNSPELDELLETAACVC